MNITKQEAQDSLAQISDAISQTRKALAHGVGSRLLIIWGFVWFMAYSATQFTPEKAGLVWMVLDGVGVIASVVCGMRSRSSYGSPNGVRVGLFWLILFAYAGFWFCLLHSQSLPSDKPSFHVEATNTKLLARQAGAFFATVPMFAYVVGGLWLGRFFIWLGLGVTLLTAVGYYFVPQWFNLWMAITGGGSLIGAGLYIRRYWK